VRFMVESPAQSGRLKTLIHPGPVSGVHVTTLKRLHSLTIVVDLRLSISAYCR